MANNAHKLWVQDTINQHSITRVAEAIQNTGASLPCSVVSVSGQIVTTIRSCNMPAVMKRTSP